MIGPSSFPYGQVPVGLTNPAAVINILSPVEVSFIQKPDPIDNLTWKCDEGECAGFDISMFVDQWAVLWGVDENMPFVDIVKAQAGMLNKTGLWEKQAAPYKPYTGVVGQQQPHLLQCFAVQNNIGIDDKEKVTGSSSDSLVHRFREAERIVVPKILDLAAETVRREALTDVLRRPVVDNDRFGVFGNRAENRGPECRQVPQAIENWNDEAVPSFPIQHDNSELSLPRIHLSQRVGAFDGVF